MIKHKHNILLVFTVFLLTGCLTSNVPAPTYYVLNPDNHIENEKSKLPVSLVIEKPSVASGLNTDRIALMKKQGRELDYFAEARWNGQLDKIVQDFIIESFENNYDIVEVDTTSLYQKADYLIVTKIRDFQAEYEQETNVAPTIKVTIVCSVLKLPEKETLSRIIKTKETKITANTMRDIIAGFESLLQETMYDVQAEIAGKL